MNRIVITEVMSAAFDVEQHTRQFFFADYVGHWSAHLICDERVAALFPWSHSLFFVCGKSGENVQRHEKVCCAFLDDRRLLGEDELCD